MEEVAPADFAMVPKRRRNIRIAADALADNRGGSRTCRCVNSGVSVQCVRLWGWSWEYIEEPATT
jgi:hypothetical protein